MNVNNDSQGVFFFCLCASYSVKNCRRKQFCWDLGLGLSKVKVRPGGSIKRRQLDMEINIWDSVVRSVLEILIWEISVYE